VAVSSPVFKPPFAWQSLPAAPRRRHLDFLTALVIAALISGWAATIISAEGAETVLDPSGAFVVVFERTLLYYVTHGLAIGFTTAAGVVAILRGRLRLLSLGARLALYVLLASTGVWAIVTYSADEWFSTTIFGSAGPFVWFTLLFILAGTYSATWTYIDPLIRNLAYISCVFAIRALIGFEYGRYIGGSKYTQYASLLLWLGGWTLLNSTRTRGWRLLCRSLPAVLMGLMALCSQSRSWVVHCCLLGLVFALLRARERGSLVQGLRYLALACALWVVVAALTYTMLPQNVSAAIEGLTARVDEDTRTGQYVAFFRVVPVTDLLFGRGPKGTWYWRNVGDYAYFDNGYLWMLFVGGVPTLVGYVVVLLRPAVQAIARRPMATDAAAAWLLLFWALALTGLSVYTLPSVGLSSQIMSLCAGRCYLFLAGARERVARIAYPYGRWPVAQPRPLMRF